MTERKRPFRKTFAAGILLLMPTLITLFLLNFLFDKVDQYFTPWFLRVVPTLDDSPRNGVPDEALFRVVVPVLGFFVFLGIIYLIGRMASHVVGKRVIHWAEQQILRVPLVKGIYGSAKQLFEAFAIDRGDSFSRVVLLEYPRRGTWTLAFVTKGLHPEIQAPTGRSDLAFVFIPTTPNPTSGFLLAVPEDDLLDTGLTVEAGLKTIVSGGMVTIGPGMDLRDGKLVPVEGAPPSSGGALPSAGATLEGDPAGSAGSAGPGDPSGPGGPEGREDRKSPVGPATFDRAGES